MGKASLYAISAKELIQSKSLVNMKSNQLIGKQHYVQQKAKKMRKKICSRCGKFINEGTKCSCAPAIQPKYNNKFSSKDDIIHTQRWRNKRLEIIKRDNFLCQRCLLKYNILNSEQLTVHHIKSRKNYPELAFDNDNLICLCDTCNKQLGTKDKLDFEIQNDNTERDYNL